MKKVIYFIVAAVVIAGLVYMIKIPPQGRPTPVDDNTSGKVDSGTDPSDTAMVHVTSPLPNEKIISPVTISGEARGSWFFEASFPIEIVDDKGTKLAQSHAEAQSDWMTENYVPFTATIKFTLPTSTDKGRIILRKDNPSGLPEHEDSIEVPVRFR